MSVVAVKGADELGATEFAGTELEPAVSVGVVLVA